MTKINISLTSPSSSKGAWYKVSQEVFLLSKTQVCRFKNLKIGHQRHYVISVWKFCFSISWLIDSLSSFTQCPCFASFPFCSLKCVVAFFREFCKNLLFMREWPTFIPIHDPLCRSLYNGPNTKVPLPPHNTPIHISSSCTLLPSFYPFNTKFLYFSPLCLPFFFHIFYPFFLPPFHIFPSSDIPSPGGDVFSSTLYLWNSLEGGGGIFQYPDFGFPT